MLIQNLSRYTKNNNIIIINAEEIVTTVSRSTNNNNYLRLIFKFYLIISPTILKTNELSNKYYLDNIPT